MCISYVYGCALHTSSMHDGKEEKYARKVCRVLTEYTYTVMYQLTENEPQNDCLYGVVYCKTYSYIDVQFSYPT